MTKKFKCSSCNTENPNEFFPNRKTLCKKCYNDRQNKLNEEKRELLEKLKAEESKPETPRARSPSPSRENYETFRQAVLDLTALLNKQAQEFEIYKFNSEAKIKSLESRIEEQEFLSENVNSYVKGQINNLFLKIQDLESKPVALSLPPVLPELPKILPAPSPTPMSPIGNDPIKKEYHKIINGINEDYNLFMNNKKPKTYIREVLIELAKKYKIKREGIKDWKGMADIIIAELDRRIIFE